MVALATATKLYALYSVYAAAAKAGGNAAAIPGVGFLLAAGIIAAVAGLAVT